MSTELSDACIDGRPQLRTGDAADLRTAAAMSLGLSVCLVAHRSRLERPGHLVPELRRQLTALGVLVTVVDPDTQALSLTDAERRPDLAVLMSGSDAALSLAGAYEARGTRLFSPYRASAGCRDKIVATGVLATAGIPMPQTWVTAAPATLSGELRRGPLLFKDPRGSRGRGIHLVRDETELLALPEATSWLVMRYHRPDGPDLKLYRIGDQVYGVTRRFPATTPADKIGRPLDVDDGLRRVVMRCADAFGLTVCGVDVILSRGRPWVVDMSSFPGFKGVPGAPRLIAVEVARRLLETQQKARP